MLPNLGPTELIIILVIVLIIFGAASRRNRRGAWARAFGSSEMPPKMISRTRRRAEAKPEAAVTKNRRRMSCRIVRFQRHDFPASGPPHCRSRWSP